MKQTDLFDFLLNEFSKSQKFDEDNKLRNDFNTENYDKLLQDVGLFVNFVRSYLSKNPPVGVGTIDYGLSIKLSDGKIFPLSTFVGKTLSMRDSGICFTQSSYNPRTEGIDDKSVIQIMVNK